MKNLKAKNSDLFELQNCTGRMNWPKRGVYFFFEHVETSRFSCNGLRVTRIGTHALKLGSKTSLWNRLAQHKGTMRSGGGNHRGSIFRLIVGSSLQLKHSNRLVKSWGIKGEIKKAAAQLLMPVVDVKAIELPIERDVSHYIGQMPFVCLDVPDAANAKSLRGVIERNSIALLSNYGKDQIDPPSADWLGHFSDRKRVQKSGLWNNNHVDEDYDPSFLGVLGNLIEDMKPL